MYEDNSSSGIMCLKLIGNRLVTARINGSLDFLEIESTLNGPQTDKLSSLSHRCETFEVTPLFKAFCVLLAPNVLDIHH